MALFPPCGLRGGHAAKITTGEVAIAGVEAVREGLARVEEEGRGAAGELGVGGCDGEPGGGGAGVDFGGDEAGGDGGHGVGVRTGR